MTDLLSRLWFVALGTAPYALMIAIVVGVFVRRVVRRTPDRSVAEIDEFLAGDHDRVTIPLHAHPRLSEEMIREIGAARGFTSVTVDRTLRSPQLILRRPREPRR